MIIDESYQKLFMNVISIAQLFNSILVLKYFSLFLNYLVNLKQFLL